MSSTTPTPPLAPRQPPSSATSPSRSGPPCTRCGGGVGFFGLPALALAWFAPDGPAAGHRYILGHGLLFGLLAAVPAVALLRRPQRAPAAAQALAAVAGAVLTFATIAYLGYNQWALDAVVPVVGLTVTAVLPRLYPARAAFWRHGAPSIPLAAITGIGGPPLGCYALQQMGAERGLATTDALGMAVLATAIVLVGAVAALRPSGWRFVAWLAGLAATTLGLAGILDPHDPGSIGLRGSIAAVVGGLAYIAVAERERRAATGRSTGTAVLGPAGGNDLPGNPRTHSKTTH